MTAHHHPPSPSPQTARHPMTTCPRVHFLVSAWAPFHTRWDSAPSSPCPCRRSCAPADRGRARVRSPDACRPPVARLRAPSPSLSRRSRRRIRRWIRRRAWVCGRCSTPWSSSARDPRCLQRLLPTAPTVHWKNVRLEVSGSAAPARQSRALSGSRSAFVQETAHCSVAAVVVT